MKTYSVYVLADDTGTVFYVGRTNDPNRRLKQHLDPLRSHNIDVHERLVAQKNPTLSVVAEYQRLEEAIAEERRLIALYPGLLNGPRKKRAKYRILRVEIHEDDLEWLEYLSKKTGKSRSGALESVFDWADEFVGIRKAARARRSPLFQTSETIQ